jgi:hypothetical protein
MKKQFMLTIHDATYALYSALFGIMLVFAQKVVVSNGIFSSNAEAYFISVNVVDILKWILYTILIYISLSFIEKVIEKAQIENSYKKRQSSIKIYFIFMFLLLLCWLPCVFTYYPGGVYSDTISSLAMAKGEVALSNHHPILYTLSWRILIYIGGIFKLDDYKILFAYTSLQTIAMAAVLAYFLYSIYRKGFSKYLVIFSAAYFGLFNLIPLYCVSLWKDTPFSIVFFLFSTFLFNVFWDDEEELNFFKPVTIFIYCILSYLISFMRNNGFYVFVFFSVVLVSYFAHKHVKKQFFCSLILSVSLICVFTIIRGPVYNSFHFNDDDAVESLGIPLQQVSYVIVNGGEVAEDDLAIINSIIPIKDLKSNYCPLIVDRIKWADSFDRDYLNANIGKFIKAYVCIIAKNPKMAFKGLVLANEGFWDLSRQTEDAYINNYMWPGVQYEMKDKIQQWFGFSLNNNYSTRIKFSSALFAWIVLGLLVIGFKRRHGGAFMPLMPAIGIWITMLIAAPLAYSLRYMFPLVLIVPLGIVNVCSPDYHSIKNRKED